MSYDVAVIGAGAAGLIAARELSRSGKRVLLLEARDRLGGRLLQARHPRALGPIELGGEFIHGRPALSYELLQEFGSTAIDDAETSFFVRDGVLKEAGADPFEMAGALLASALESTRDCTVDELIARVARDPARREAGKMTWRLVAGFDAADPARASARAVALEWVGDASAGGAQARPLGGYAPLIAHLGLSLDRTLVDVRMQTVVTAIARDRRGVRIRMRGTARETTIEARHAIVTVPHGVLLAADGAEGSLEFTPPLPASTRTAIEQIAMGPVVKIVLCFQTPFWEKLDNGAWRDGAFFGGDGVFPTFWTQLPVRANVLTAWAGGPVADRFNGASFEERVRLALDCAAQYFGDAAAVRDAFECAYAHDWESDPFSRGAYSYVLVGGERARETLAKPVDGVLRFAGEATASHGEGGTVAGALESGLRAAREILAEARV